MILAYSEAPQSVRGDPCLWQTDNPVDPLETRNWNLLAVVERLARRLVGFETGRGRPDRNEAERFLPQ